MQNSDSQIHKQTCDYQRRAGRGRGKIGVWDQEIQATICKIDKQQ